MEMHQFLGDLITSGNSSKNPPDVFNAAWGVAGGGAADGALAFKATSLEPLRPVREKMGAGASQRARETRDRREGRSRVNKQVHPFSCKFYFPTDVVRFVLQL